MADYRVKANLYKDSGLTLDQMKGIGSIRVRNLSVSAINLIIEDKSKDEHPDDKNLFWKESHRIRPSRLYWGELDLGEYTASEPPNAIVEGYKELSKSETTQAYSGRKDRDPLLNPFLNAQIYIVERGGNITRFSRHEFDFDKA